MMPGSISVSRSNMIVDRDNESDVFLTGGNMNTPVLRGGLVYKEATIASDTIHALIRHVRAKGITWVPESFGVNDDGKHVWEYIEGEAVHDRPDWLWDERILLKIARRLRLWHDATSDFVQANAKWLLENNEDHEVICHNDFAPYNCVFQDGDFAGLIDFDVCSPGSRLWDIAYTVYRFVPVQPPENEGLYGESSPFARVEIIKRLELFLVAYSGHNRTLLYDVSDVLQVVTRRLSALASWSEAYSIESNNDDLARNAQMYKLHADWIKSLLV